MAHMIEQMAYYGERPWHGLGQEVLQAMTSEEALKAGGLDWDVAQVTPKFDIIQMDGNRRSVEVPGYSVVVRTKDMQPLSIMSENYKPHAPREAFKFFDTVVGDKLAIYHTVGSLNGGKKIWMLAKLPGEIRIPGTDDITEKFLLLATSFDGSLATIMKLTPTRVVCQNTLSIAVQGEGEYVKVRHSRRLSSMVDEAKRVFQIALDNYDAFEHTAHRFAKEQFNDAQMMKLAHDLFPTKENGEVTPANFKARALVQQLFVNGAGQDMVRGTKWAALNAVTEYTDHHIKVRETTRRAAADARMSSIWFGGADDLKAKAFNILLAA
jgi:phage/plasmid-like protein (TIGR03299 family)